MPTDLYHNRYNDEVPDENITGRERDLFSDYTLGEARTAVAWYKETFGTDLSYRLTGMVPGQALNDFVNRIYLNNQ